MIAKIKHDDQIYDIDMDTGVDLSINNDFSGNAPLFYGADQPEVEPEGDTTCMQETVSPITIINRLGNKSFRYLFII